MSDKDQAGARITAPAAQAVDTNDSPCTCPLCSSPFSTGVHRGPAFVPANPPIGETVDLAAIQARVLQAGRSS